MAKVALFLLASSSQVVVGLCLESVWLREQIIEGKPLTFFSMIIDYYWVLDGLAKRCRVFCPVPNSLL